MLFSNENEGFNKFDSIPVEAQDILQAAKNLNFPKCENRNESFTEIRNTLIDIFDAEIRSPNSSIEISLKYFGPKFSVAKFCWISDTNFNCKADYKLFKSMNNPKFNS